MTHTELYILNNVLDKKDIFSVPSFSNKSVSRLLVNQVKNTLIKKKMLKDYENFTKEGALLLKKISQFKEAEKYIRAAGIVIGKTNNDHGILLYNNGGNYDFYRIDLCDVTKQICKAYPFLDFEYKRGKNQEITSQELFSQYKFKANESFLLEEYDVTVSQTKKDLIFKSDDRLLRYSKDDNTLYAITKEDTVNLINHALYEKEE